MNPLFINFLLDAVTAADSVATAAAAPAQESAQKPGGGWTMWVMLGLVFVVMYVFMILPQRKQQKQLQQFRSGLKKGDKVVTIGGIYGEIVEVNDADNTILVKVDGDVKIRFSKDAIQNPGAPQRR